MSAETVSQLMEGLYEIKEELSSQDYLEFSNLLQKTYNRYSVNTEEESDEESDEEIDVVSVYYRDGSKLYYDEENHQYYSVDSQEKTTAKFYGPLTAYPHATGSEFFELYPQWSRY